MNRRTSRTWIKSATVALAMITGLSLAASAQPIAQLQGVSSRPANIRISGPYIKNNLSIFLIHGQDSIKGKNFLTLQEALKQQKVTVYETGNVNELAIENRSNELVFIQSGEIVKGGQQDRTFQSDIILPPHSGKVPISSFCVEHGRWSQRGHESAGNFAASPAALPTAALKMAARYSANQSEVWAKVEEAQHKLSAGVGAGGSVASPASPSSLELSLENKDVQKHAEDRSAGLAKIIDDKNDVIGYACAINGKVTSADMYASHALFKKLWPKLLQASAVESLTEYQAGKPVPKVDVAAVNGFLAKPAKAKPSERNINARVKEIRQESSDNVMFETIDRAGQDAFVHKNYLTK